MRMTHPRMLFVILICLGILTGCSGVARMSDFPRTSEILDFDKLAQANYDSKNAIWNEQTKYEYFVEVERADEDELFTSIIYALTGSGYSISYANKQDRVVIGERGLRLNEWKSITGVYFKGREELFQVFFKNAITQDITGGWRENRAKEVATVFCTSLTKCKRTPE
jgi:hypothetical protein